MTDVSQDFESFAGDAVTPAYLVSGEDGSPLPLQDASEIIWLVVETITDAAPLMIKKLTLGEITLPNNGGADGKMLVPILNGDSAPFCGYYFTKVKVIDKATPPDASTVTLGIWRVKPNIGGV